MKDLIQKIRRLPTQPGCYLFKDRDGTILYVGKAKNLKKRISNYFQKRDHDSKTMTLVSRIHDFDFFITRTEVEALILENNLIKKHYPRFNIDLKDSRRYAYLKLHKEEDYPWLETVRKREGVGEYYGPFVSGTMRKYIVDVLRRNFKILMGKPSLAFKKIIDKKDYGLRVIQARKILGGQVDEVVRELTIEMKKSSADLNVKRFAIEI